MPGKVKHTDHTATLGFERAGQNIIPIQPWQCPHCLRKFGEIGRRAAQVKIITAEGHDKWCQECYEKGLKEGICIKAEKLSRKKLRKKAPKCKKCGRKMIPVKDPKAKKYTGYLWRCKCMPGLIISIG